MAYAALVSLSQTIDQTLMNHHKYSISVNQKETFISIKEYVNFLLSFLEDFPEKANHWEGQISHVANETEDMIEHFMWNQIQSRYKWTSQTGLEFDDQLKKATEQIGLILGEMMEDRLGDSPALISSSSFTVAGKYDKLIGLDEDLMAIKSRLCGESSKLLVIPIVGMGGIGKTTLARKAYDDPLMMEHFHVRAWVSISQCYNKEEILSSLLGSVKLFDEQINRQKNDKLMAQKVYKSLKGRKYLIVMDDVSSTEVLDDVRNIFPDDNNGSRIMLTTRLSDVASYADSCGPLHEMRFLDVNQSWDLLKRNVFGKDEECPHELEDIGKVIARSCRGLPLAVVLLAGILSTVLPTRVSWEEIAKNVNSVVDGQLEKILSLSYMHLPHHLRPCFLFLGGFPEDSNICVSRLIKLWVTEGFLRRDDRYKSLEEEAEAYLEDLVRRSLVLITARTSNGKIKSCSLHDLVRDLCVRKSREEKFLLHVADRYVLPQNIMAERRLSTTHSYHLNSICGPTIHTVVYFQLKDSCSTSLDFLGRFRLLRVLDVVNTSYIQLPSQVFELFHLRYLALRNPVDIPSTILNLKNLQILIICPRFRHECLSFYSSIPPEIWRMTQLRHLVLFHFYELSDPPPSDGSSLSLDNLQTLSSVASFVCSENVLTMIPNVKKLGLIYDDSKKYHLHNLVHLNQLESLKVTMYGKSSWQGQNPAFPRTLKKLTLSGGEFPWKDMTIIGSLPYLEVLKLRNFACNGDSWETVDGEFPRLKFLLLEKSDLKSWITESNHFPRLMCLILRHCRYLSEIPRDIGEIPTLELIDVSGWNKSLLDSARQIQEDQQSYGNYELRVHATYSYKGWSQDYM